MSGFFLIYVICGICGEVVMSKKCLCNLIVCGNNLKNTNIYLFIIQYVIGMVGIFCRLFSFCNPPTNNINTTNNILGAI